MKRLEAALKSRSDPCLPVPVQVEQAGIPFASYGDPVVQGSK